MNQESIVQPALLHNGKLAIVSSMCACKYSQFQRLKTDVLTSLMVIRRCSQDQEKDENLRDSPVTFVLYLKVFS